METEDNHSCIGNLEPEYTGMRERYPTEHVPVISGTASSAGVTLHMECSVCGTKHEADYEYVEAMPVE